MAFKRSDWNELIQEVNDILQNPPDGCEPLEPIDEVGERHRWKKSDIRAIQEAISETCPDIQWEDIPDKWKQSIPDEIREKLGEAWCECDECEPEFIFIPDQDTILFDHTPSVRVVTGPQPSFPDIDLQDFIVGSVVGPPGVTGRSYGFREVRGGAWNGAIFGKGFGEIDCNGVALPANPSTSTMITNPFYWDAPVNCPNGMTPQCEAAVEAMQASLNGTLWFPRQIIMSVSLTGFKTCEEC